MAHRLGANPRSPQYAGLTRATRDGPDWTGEVRLVPGALGVPKRWRKPRRIAVSLMGDFFRADRHDRGLVFAAMEAACQHTYLLLTKQTEMAVDSLEAPLAVSPLPHVWIGFSAEDQSWFDHRAADARRWAALGWHTWVSLEPLLGPVDLRGALAEGLEWVVAGGESGPGARPVHPSWVRGLRDQCTAAGVPFHWKQWGDWLPIDQMSDATWARLDDGDPNLVNGTAGPWGSHPAPGVYRVGKRTAGALLDGVSCQAFPVFERGRNVRGEGQLWLMF